MAFAQLTYRESLRDIEACLRAMAGKLYHRGIQGVARNTLANANKVRDWRIYADFAHVSIACWMTGYGEPSVPAFGCSRSSLTPGPRTATPS